MDFSCNVEGVIRGGHLGSRYSSVSDRFYSLRHLIRDDDRTWTLDHEYAYMANSKSADDGNAPRSFEQQTSQ